MAERDGNRQGRSSGVERVNMRGETRTAEEEGAFVGMLGLAAGCTPGMVAWTNPLVSVRV